jgi:hypothetical protein
MLFLPSDACACEKNVTGVVRVTDGVDGDPADGVTCQLDLAGVNTRRSARYLRKRTGKLVDA